jgi:hypothetical protein
VSGAKRGYVRPVFAEAATVQVLLEGVPLPADKRELIEYAREQRGGGSAEQLLERLPDRRYKTLDEVGEELVHVQPVARNEDSDVPHAESGPPPGGEDYDDPNPVPGGVRDDAPPDNPPQQTIEQQTKIQNEQKERQEKELGASS